MELKLYKITDKQSGNVAIVNELKLMEQAIHYYANSEVEDDIDFSIIENCIDFIRRVDYVDEVDEQLKQLIEFKEHMMQTLDYFFQMMDENRENELEAFDITFEFYGKKLKMPLNAEAFHRLEELIQAEIKEY